MLNGCCLRFFSPGGHTYAYDAENRLIQVDSSAIQYAYDYAGRRIKSTVGSNTTYHFYGLTGLMSEFSTGTGGVSGAAPTDRLQYRVGEQTGTALMLVDPDGTPRENNRVFPFGEPWLAFAASNNSEKFTTYQHDGENGEADLDYAMARYYASRSGRFMTPDPGHIGADIGDPQSWNAYVYALNDPVDLTDPTGEFPWKLFARIAAVVVSAFVPPAAPFLGGAAVGVGVIPSGTPPFNPDAPSPLPSQGPSEGVVYTTPPFNPNAQSPSSTSGNVYRTPPFIPGGLDSFPATSRNSFAQGNQLPTASGWKKPLFKALNCVADALPKEIAANTEQLKTDLKRSVILGPAIGVGTCSAIVISEPYLAPAWPGCVAGTSVSTTALLARISFAR